MINPIVFSPTLLYSTSLWYITATYPSIFLKFFSHLVYTLHNPNSSLFVLSSPNYEGLPRFCSWAICSLYVGTTSLTCASSVTSTRMIPEPSSLAVLVNISMCVFCCYLKLTKYKITFTFIINESHFFIYLPIVPFLSQFC